MGDTEPRNVGFICSILLVNGWTYLADGGCKHVDDAFMCDGNNAVCVDLNDAVPNTNATPLRDATTQQATDLENTQVSHVR